MLTSPLTRVLTLAGALALLAPAVGAQPRPSAAPTAGTIASDGGSLDVRAGGPDRNPSPGSGCSGFIASGAPLAAVQHTGGPLSIFATSATDTTLLVADPSGRWHCSDDADDINPGVTFDSAAAGTYAVWIGTFSPEAAGAAAMLRAVRGQPTW